MTPRCVYFSTITKDQADALIKECAKAYAKDNKLSDDDGEAALCEKLNGCSKQSHGTTVSKLLAYQTTCIY